MEDKFATKFNKYEKKHGIDLPEAMGGGMYLGQIHDMCFQNLYFDCECISNGMAVDTGLVLDEYHLEAFRKWNQCLLNNNKDKHLPGDIYWPESFFTQVFNVAKIGSVSWNSRVKKATPSIVTADTKPYERFAPWVSKHEFVIERVPSFAFDIKTKMFKKEKPKTLLFERFTENMKENPTGDFLRELKDGDRCLEF